MAEPNDGDKFKPLLTGFLSIVMVTGGYFYYQNPLKSFRPIDQEAAKKAASHDKDKVQARLWQDPFEAVKTHQLALLEDKKNYPHKATSDPSFEKVIQEIKKTEEGNSIYFRVLPVFVDGSPYASGEQSRLKDRYAVISALGAAGYMPESGEFIRYFKSPDSKLEPGNIIPMEWFKPNTEIRYSRPEHILILWLKDQNFSEKPLQHLNALMNNLNKQLNPKNYQGKKTLYKILGPRFSDTLSTMLKEIQTSKSKKDFEALKHAQIYSYSATAQDTFLLAGLLKKSTLASNLVSPCPAGLSVEKWFKCIDIELFRTSGTDGDLAKELIKELQLRKVNITCSELSKCTPPLIALISEWDTLYGRALPRTFFLEAGYRPQCKAEDKSICDADKNKYNINDLSNEQWPNSLYYYSYLAGLDGELPQKEKDKESSENKKSSMDDKEQRKQRDIAELPTGRSQLDYVQRLITDLKYREEKYRKDILSEDSKHTSWADKRDTEFQAIGILGSDVYDKLLLFQALKKEFPRAIFFTTDLDANLFRFDQWPWTRNLIVASHYGLQLHYELQQPIPPFRDSSQTSLFYSTLRALDHLTPVSGSRPLQQTPHGMIYSTNVTPRIYEIGRHGPIDISPDTPVNLDDIHLERPDFDYKTSQLLFPVSLRTIMLSFIATILLGLCASLISHEASIFFKKEWARIIVWTTLLLALLGMIWAHSHKAEDEPFTLFEGVSIWPTVLIRLLAIVLCVISIRLVYRQLGKSDEDLTKRFSPFKVEADRYENIITAGWKRCRSIHDWHNKERKEVDVTELWQEYQKLQQRKYIMWRIIPQISFYFIFGWLTLFLSGMPSIPCRGEACFTIYEFFMYTSVLLMITLMFYVIDATRLCRGFITSLEKSKFRWNENNFTSVYAEKLGVDKNLLNEYMCIDLISERTGVISKLLWLPFIILFLMIISRQNYVDNYDESIWLIVIYCLTAAYVFGTVVALRFTAMRAKEAAIEQLNDKFSNASSIQKRNIREEREREITLVINKIRDNRKGAFLPLHHHPLFQIALPAGATGFLYLIDSLTRMS